MHSRMQGRPVNELLDVPLERPTVDQLKIEVGHTKKDRVVTGLTGDHGKDGQLDSVDEAPPKISMKPPTTIAAMTTNALCHGFCERPRVSMSLPPLRLFSILTSRCLSPSCAGWLSG